MQEVNNPSKSTFVVLYRISFLIYGICYHILCFRIYRVSFHICKWLVCERELGLYTNPHNLLIKVVGNCATMGVLTLLNAL